MSCLLPQFNLRTPSLPSNSHLSKTRDPTCFVQCVLSAASPSTLEATISDTPWSYTGSIGPLSEMPFSAGKAKFQAAETLVRSEEAVIAAAAAEAVTLAKAAVQLARDAAAMVAVRGAVLKDRDPKSDEPLAMVAVPEDRDPKSGDDDVEPSAKELMAIQEQLSGVAAVRSERQGERKAKRDRAADRAASSIVSVKSGSGGRKKRSAAQDVDRTDPLRYLRSTTASSRLLTMAEEIELSAGIQELLKMEKLQVELTERCGCEPTFSQWAAAAGVDQKTLRRRINHGSLCKDKMIKSNIRLVISIAKNYQGAGMNLQDLVQEGCRGLVKGAEKFDASKGFKFSTYAHWWIKQAVRKSLSDQSRTIRLPFHMVEATYRVKEARKQLYTENGTYPENEEIAEAAGLSMKRLNAVLMAPKAPRSLEQKVGINMNLKPSEVISSPDAETTEDVLLKQFMKKDLEKVLDSLSVREQQVIRWRFGMEDGRMKTLQEIGELMGVSRERIRQIESCAFRKLKNKKRTKHLHQYILS